MTWNKYRLLTVSREISQDNWVWFIQYIIRKRLPECSTIWESKLQSVITAFLRFAAVFPLAHKNNTAFWQRLFLRPLSKRATCLDRVSIFICSDSGVRLMVRSIPPFPQIWQNAQMSVTAVHLRKPLLLSLALSLLIDLQSKYRKFSELNLVRKPHKGKQKT